MDVKLESLHEVALEVLNRIQQPIKSFTRCELAILEAALSPPKASSHERKYTQLQPYKL